MRIEKANPDMSIDERLLYHMAGIVEGIINIPLSFFGLIFDGWSFDIVIRSAKKQVKKALEKEKKLTLYHDISCNCYACRDGSSHRAKD